MHEGFNFTASWPSLVMFWVTVIPVGVKWYHMWFRFVFPWWFTTFSIFFCACWSFTSLPWRNVYSSPLPGLVFFFFFSRFFNFARFWIGLVGKQFEKINYVWSFIVSSTGDPSQKQIIQTMYKWDRRAKLNAPLSRYAVGVCGERNTSVASPGCMWRVTCSLSVFTSLS